jgi:hypothetical protein
MKHANKNSVKLKDGIIFITQVGDQTYESIDGITKEVQRLSVGLKEVKILVDHHQAGKLDIGARKAGFEVGRTLHFDKMAFYGTSPYMVGLINLLARSVGKRDKAHFAKTYEEALAWLET